ncbi:Acetyltransferase, GNAT family [Bisporella sp. PMI_857]|nr:Acetyltransferase, GNAT family [Bisporella sp. PMI_857]
MSSTDAGASRFQLRVATLEDIPQMRLLIDFSVRTLHPRYYSPAQIAGALESIYGIDTQVIADGHYFVAEAASPENDHKFTMIACGGWSHRSTLFGGDQYVHRDDNLLDPKFDAAKIRAFFVHPDWTRQGVGGIVLDACEAAARKAGFKRTETGSTLAGVEFYRMKGYREIENGRIMSPVGDPEVGVMLEAVRMEKEL